jgi:predicted esterase
MPPIEVHLVPTLTHGRVLTRAAHAARSRGVLVGYHGYMEHAEIQMRRLEEIPGASQWTLVSIQGLHRFYRGRSEEVVASWMTRQDRELAIADNLAYVAAALDAVPNDDSGHVVHIGFSQGAAMGFRAAARVPPAAAVVAIGGDVPPELHDDAAVRLPPVLLVRGDRDEWYTQTKLEADAAALRARGVAVESHVVRGGHEWSAAVAAVVGEFIEHGTAGT